MEETNFKSAVDSWVDTFGEFIDKITNRETPTPQEEKRLDDIKEQIREQDLHNENLQKDKI